MDRQIDRQDSIDQIDRMREKERKKDGQIDRQIGFDRLDRQDERERKKERWIDRQTDRQIVRQMDMCMYFKIRQHI